MKISAPALFLLFAGATHARPPTEYEQYLVELVNRARADPDAEAARVGIDLNEGLFPGQIASGPREPLAVNPEVTQAAADYAQVLADNDALANNFGGSTLSGRLSGAGYTLLPTPAGAIDSLGAQVSAGPLTISKELVDDQYVEWFVSAGVPNRLDRLKMFNFYREIGAGLVEADDYTFYGGGTPFAMVSVLNYTYRNTLAISQPGATLFDGAFITGVAYHDLDGDAFYTPGTGEALGNIGIEVYDADTDAFVTSGVTFDSGGYSFLLPNGNYDVVFASPGGPVAFEDIAVAGANVKLDLVAVPEPGSALLLGLAALGFAVRRRGRE